MAKKYVSPESRFRMPSLFGGIGRKMGEMLLSGSRFGEKKRKVHTEAMPYDLLHLMSQINLMLKLLKLN